MTCGIDAGLRIFLHSSNRSIDLRNFSVHAYWNLRPSVIWDTMQNDLPPLVEPLRMLLPDDAV